MEPCPNCGKSTRKLNDCAPRMSDGRVFTDYRPRCTVQYQILNEKQGSYAARQYMISNANALMKDNLHVAEKNSKCDCYPKNAQGTEMPPSQVQKCNSKSCTVSKPDSKGVGLVRA